MQRQLPWEEYYAKVIRQPHHSIVEQAVEHVANKPQRVAIDCGCGTGRDTAYLLAQGFEVHAFDSELSALEICEKRFAGNRLLHLTHSSFEAFAYPTADLIVANLALFFCNPEGFQGVWRKISDALPVNGVFCGDILGLKDSWAQAEGRTVTALAEVEVRALFEQFEIIGWHEQDEFGRTALGREKHWHFYSILAKKQR